MIRESSLRPADRPPPRARMAPAVRLPPEPHGPVSPPTTINFHLREIIQWTANIRIRASSRGLKNRHIQLIALGGAIGTGLFLGSAGVLKSAGRR